MDASSSKEQLELIEKERKQLREQIAADDDDALAPYERYVEWLTQHAQTMPHGPFDLELLTVLEEAVRSRKDDPDYKNDVRYVKLWLTYARLVDKPDVVFVYLLKTEIGAKNAQLYEDYATSLETQDRLREAEQAYRLGIQKSKRGADRLKARYREFKGRVESKNTLKPSRKPPYIPPGESSSLGAKLYRNPLRNFTSKRSNGITISAAPKEDDTVATPESPVKKEELEKRSSDPYTHMKAVLTAPPAPGKREEKYQIDMSLLFKEGQEFCIQEARAASLGLLGKKWDPPSPSELGARHQAPRAKEATVNLKDEGTRQATRTNNMHLNLNMTAQLADGPTVTLNTKEALRDVYGMYNSPDRTIRTAKLAVGTKFAPIKKLELAAPQPRRTLNENEADRTPFGSAPFQPYIDPDEGDRKENVTPGPAPVKFKPFVNENAGITPRVTPKPRKGLALKEIPSTAPILRQENEQEEQQEEKAESQPEKPVAENSRPENIFGPVFKPRSKTDKGRMALQPKPTQEDRPSIFSNTKTQTSLQRPDIFGPVFSRSKGSRPFSGLESAITRTSQDENKNNQDENKNVPLFQRSTSVPQHIFRPKEPPFARRPPLEPAGAEPRHEAESDPECEVDPELEPEPEIEPEIEEEIEEYGDDFESESPSDEPQEGDCYYDDDEPHNLPMGGRFGRFDVLTPIAERTFECTMTQRTFLGTPSHTKEPVLDKDFPSHSRDAALAAEKLARELRENELEEKKKDEAMNGVIDIEEEDSPPPEETREEDKELVERTGALSLADTLAVASSFKPPNPCNPSDPHILTTLLSLIPPEPDFYDLRTEVSDKFDSLQKFANKHVRRGSGRSTSSRSSDGAESFRLQLPDQAFLISDKLGEGGFGAVFKAKVIQPDAETDDDDMDLDGESDEEDSNFFALKVVKPRNIWEFHILRRLHSVLPEPRGESVIYPHALYAFKDESYLVLDLCNQGTLLDVINHAGDAGVLHQGACLDELLVMFFAIELIKFVESLHSIGFIHGDLKIDNCLLRLEEVPGGSNAWSGMYQPTGEGGWKYKGIRMIDFGRTIDTRMYPAGQIFIADWKTDVYDCLEMRENRPWTYETDYFGLAGIVYCMLFGKYFDSGTVVPIPSTDPVRYKLSSQFKRYWQSDLWSRLFDLLLNPTLVRSDRSLPLVPELGALREEMEAWLTSNCSRSTNTLKGLLKKIERSVLSSSR